MNMINSIGRLFKLTVALTVMLISNAASADVLQEIVKSGKLRVGVSLFVPWTMQDNNGQLSGFEIDVANKIALDMGVEAELKVYEWNSIIDALNTGEIDMIAGGMAITPARALKVNFSRPYAESGIKLIANTAKTRNIEGMDHANQPEIEFGVVEASASNELATRLFDKATIKTFKTGDEVAKALLAGELHAALGSTPQPELLAQMHPDTLDLPLDEPLVTYKAGLAVSKGEQEWLNFLNAWVTARNADSWLEATHAYWFESLAWRK